MTDNDDHLPADEPDTVFTTAKTFKEYGAIGVPKNAMYYRMSITYKALDYLANLECPATFTKGNTGARAGEYYDISFPNGNKITIKEYLHPWIPNHSFIWVGRDGNLKVSHVKHAKGAPQEAKSVVFSSYEKCGKSFLNTQTWR